MAVAEAMFFFSRGADRLSGQAANKAPDLPPRRSKMGDVKCLNVIKGGGINAYGDNLRRFNFQEHTQTTFIYDSLKNSSSFFCVLIKLRLPKC